jgi:glycosyltransferase involved in cell wall biosynthesis
MAKARSFRHQIKAALHEFLLHQQSLYPSEQCLRIDLHCHDCNSDIPDELMGRILHVPETWLPTKKLIQALERNGTDVFTITNHNNARSCWQLLDEGIDVLPGAEFTCHIPEFNAAVHVLAYGFDPTEEEELYRLRRDLYRFQAYACHRDIPTILAHPLHPHIESGTPTLALLDRLGIMFERFEVLNGQRDTWTNLLAAAWVRSLTPERIDRLAKNADLRPSDYCRNPYRKIMCGGSDDHMGIFAGSSGSLLFIPGLEEARRRFPVSQLALEALRAGRAAPFGSYNEEEKLTVSFLHYFCQLALNMKDPGLLRMMLHKGSLQAKVFGLIVANVMLELQCHRFTLRFLRSFHDALSGNPPGFRDSLMLGRPFRPLLQQVEYIAAQSQASPQNLLEAVRVAIPKIYRTLNMILAERIESKCKRFSSGNPPPESPSKEWVRRFEIPSHFRAHFGNDTQPHRGDMSSINLGEFMDGLSFPALFSAVIAGATYASNRVLFQNRGLLTQLSRSLGQYEPPTRALWLTDSFFDHNGVSTALQATLREVQQQDLPIDILTCHPTQPSEEHLVVLRPIAEFSFPFYRSQIIRLPDIFELVRRFRDGSYDRVVCSTEMLMGMMALYLKTSFSVPSYFYVHTDWLDFAQKTLKLEQRPTDRIRRFLRALYRTFDGILVLNSEHVEWLSGPSMGIPLERIFTTAHWADDIFRRLPGARSRVFPNLPEGARIVLYAGRISDEKGVMLLPEIYRKLRAEVPSVSMVIAGDGPALSRLKKAMPEAHYLGWVDHERLPEIFSAADLLLFPSRFDTFGCAVLEAMSCGLPVAAFRTKGPRDLIEDGVSGILVDHTEEFAKRIVQVLVDEEELKSMGQTGMSTAGSYTASDIMGRFVNQIGLTNLAGNNGAGAPETLQAGGALLEELLEIAAHR